MPRSDAALASTRDDPVESSISHEECSLIRAALERLPLSERSALVSRFYAGLTANESAAALGISEACFRQRIHRALLRLKGMIGKDSPSHSSS